MQSFAFHATEEKELHIVNAHKVALVVGEDVAVVELVVLLVVVEVVFEFAMKKAPKGLAVHVGGHAALNWITSAPMRSLSR